MGYASAARIVTGSKQSRRLTLPFHLCGLTTHWKRDTAVKTARVVFPVRHKCKRFPNSRRSLDERFNQVD